MIYPFTRALITGASSGIGEGIARELGSVGVDLVVTARRAERLHELAAEYPGTEVIVADLETADGRAAVTLRLAATQAPIDLLVNNAGFGTSSNLVDIDPERTEREITLNVIAVTALARAALPRMIAAGRGWIINVASVASFQPLPGMAVYAATKAYVLSFSEALHEEVRRSGVGVTALCPGLVKTEFQSISSAFEHAAHLPAMAWLPIDQVVREGLRDCAHGRAVSVPGLQYKAAVTASSLAPRALVRRMAGIVHRT